MIEVLISCTQISTLHKRKAHAYINGNDHAYTLAKYGCELDHIDATTPYEHAHLHHIASKKIGGTQCKRHQTKVPLDTLENISLSMTIETT